MYDDLIKKLTGKNKADYEQAADYFINCADVAVFEELVKKDDFLFDFVKQNVCQRLKNAVNEQNFTNLLTLMKIYSPSYEDFIVDSLVKFANEDLTDKMLTLLTDGETNEKIYAAKYFYYIQDSLAVEQLRINAFSENEYLSGNSAAALGKFKDRISFAAALAKLKSGDEFIKLSAVKFLTSYGDISAVPFIIDTMKKSSMSENIAAEIPYLENIFDLLDKYPDDTLLILNNIINGLGEILPLSSVFDYELFDVFERLINNLDTGQAAVLILNAKEKFNILTENDEYLFDEDKSVKNEVYDIKKLLSHTNRKLLEKYINSELNETSPFVFTALDFATDIYAIRELLKSNNQTIILKTVEILKKSGNLDENSKTVALLKVTDANIKSIIRAL